MKSGNFGQNKNNVSPAKFSIAENDEGHFNELVENYEDIEAGGDDNRKKTENILITKDGDGEVLDAHEPPP